MGLQWSPVRWLNNFSCKVKAMVFKANLKIMFIIPVYIYVCVCVKCMLSYWCVNKLRLEDKGKKKTKQKHFNL